MRKRDFHSEDFSNIKCSYCRKRYNLTEITKEADDNNYRNLYCPNCGKKVGELN